MGKQTAYCSIWLIDNILSIAMIVVVMLLVSFGVYAIWDTNTVIAAATSAQYEIYKPKTDTENGRDSFKELQAKNSEVLGWLTVYGTHIDFPLVRAEDNFTYLTTNAEGDYSLSGAIFLDYRNDRSFKDFNTLIYGHHMDHDAMFGDVSDFKDREFFGGHEYGNLYFDDKDHGIEFFAFIEVDAYNSMVYKPGLEKVEEKEQYIADIEKEAMFTRDIGVTADDRIILLSTCTTDITNGRHLLVGKITDETYNDAFAVREDEQQPAQQVISVDSNEKRQIWDVIPLPMLIAVLALVIMLVIVRVFRAKPYIGKHVKEDERQRRYKR